MEYVDLQPHGNADSTDKGAIADAAALANYWNDGVSEAVNVATIGWWLNQANSTEIPDLTEREPLK